MPFIFCWKYITSPGRPDWGLCSTQMGAKNPPWGAVVFLQSSMCLLPGAKYGIKSVPKWAPDEHKTLQEVEFLFLHITMFVLSGAKSGIKSVPKWTQYEDIIQHQVGIPAGQSALGGATLVPVGPNKRWVPCPPFWARNELILGPGKVAGWPQNGRSANPLFLKKVAP